MIKTYLSLFNTTCCLSFDQLFFLFCDQFKGEFDVSFANLKGTEFGKKVEELKRERRANRYQGKSLTSEAVLCAIKQQLPRSFVDEVQSCIMIPSDVTNIVNNERARGNYVTRKEAYRALIDYIHGEIISAVKKYEYKSTQYLEAVKWREIEVKFLSEEIKRRQVQMFMEKRKQEVEQDVAGIEKAKKWLEMKENRMSEIQRMNEKKEEERKEMLEQKRKEEWLKIREQKIAAEMNDLDEEMIAMEKEKFEQDQIMSEIGGFVSKIENVYLKYVVFEQIREYQQHDTYWPCEMVNDSEVYHYYISTRTCKIDFKIVDPYHIYIIYQILKEGAKAYRHSFVKEKEIQVLLYILGLDPSPDIEIVVVFHDLCKVRNTVYDEALEQVKYEMEKFDF